MIDRALENKLTQVFKRLITSSFNIVSVKALTEGAGSQTLKIDIEQDTGIERYIARIAHDGALFSEAISKTQEAHIQRAAFENGVLVAPVLVVFEADDQLGQGYIMPFFEGETRPKKLLLSDKYTTARSVIIRQVASSLASIHAIDTEILDSNEHRILKRKTTADQLENLYHEFLSYNEPLPVFHYAFRYLKQYCPKDEELCVVHGDFRNGNLMANQHGLVAVLDWELSHIGNPLIDLGWFCVNSWRFMKPELPAGGFGGYEEFIDSYNEFSGKSVNVDKLLYWELLGVLRWGVLCLYQTSIHLNGEERSVERAAIGRRVSECEIDMLVLLEKLIANNDC
jgi:aminoglycoside phosphotransferase (APT) family kinase protein